MYDLEWKLWEALACPEPARVYPQPSIYLTKSSERYKEVSNCVFLKILTDKIEFAGKHVSTSSQTQQDEL